MTDVTATIAEPDASVVKVATPTPDGGTIEATTVKSNRSWFGALFASGDMSADSLIVSMIFSTIAYWFLMTWMIVKDHPLDPLSIGGGFAAMMAAFAGGKAARDWRRGADGSS